MSRVAIPVGADTDGIRLRDRTEATQAVFRSVLRDLRPNRPLLAVEVRFRPYARMRSRVRFDRDGMRILADLSDLLLEAPRSTLESLAELLLSKLYGMPVPQDARDAFNRWANQPENHRRRLETERARGRKRMLSPKGRTHDLDALFDHLNERLFDRSLHKPALGWSPQTSRRRLGHYDAAHDAIVISRILDQPEAPRLALEYVLYHEMLHVKHPVRLSEGHRCVHTPEFLADERRFPGGDEAKRLLRKISAKTRPPLPRTRYSSG